MAAAKPKRAQKQKHRVSLKGGSLSLSFFILTFGYNPCEPAWMSE